MSCVLIKIPYFFSPQDKATMSGVDEMYMENLDEWIFEENKVSLNYLL
jgi:hypothetical protein